MKHVKYMLVLMVSAATWGAQAQNPSSCEGVFRAAYMEHAKTQNATLNDARLIYQIYFDYRNNLQEAYDAARPIFRALNIQFADEILVLEELSSQMKQGSLCQGGKPKNLNQVIEILRIRQF